MKTRTRKLLSCAALAAGTLLAQASASEQEAASTEPGRARRAPSRAAASRASQATESLLATLKGAPDPSALEAARCRIGNGKSALYTDGLYGCLTALADGRHVVFLPRSEGRR